MMSGNGDVSGAFDSRLEFAWHLETVATRVDHGDNHKRDLGNRGVIAASTAIHVSSD